MTDLENFDTLLKIAIIGEAGVGKTNLLLRYADDRFEEHSRSTIGVDLKSKLARVADRNVKIQLYDSAGQERFRSLAPLNLQKADVAILVYDISRRGTFEKLTYWLDVLRAHSKANISLLFIANKMDLHSERQISTEEGLKFANEEKGFFFETSAKTNEGNYVNIAFDKIIDKAVRELVESEEQMEELEKGRARRTTMTLRKKEVKSLGNNKGCC